MRFFFLFALFLLAACSPAKTRQWEMDKIVTRRLGFNGGRLLLGPDSDSSHLEFDILRTSSGIRFYINVLSLQARPWADDPSKTTMTILYEDKEPLVIHPYLLDGGQKILLPGDIADALIQSLLSDETFIIKMGRSEISSTSTKFAELYKKFLDLSIEEVVSSQPCEPSIETLD